MVKKRTHFRQTSLRLIVSFERNVASLLSNVQSIYEFNNREKINKSVPRWPPFSVCKSVTGLWSAMQMRCRPTISVTCDWGTSVQDWGCLSSTLSLLVSVGKNAFWVLSFWGAAWTVRLLAAAGLGLQVLLETVTWWPVNELLKGHIMTTSMGGTTPVQLHWPRTN